MNLASYFKLKLQFLDHLGSHFFFLTSSISNRDGSHLMAIDLFLILIYILTFSLLLSGEFGSFFDGSPYD